MKSKRRYAVICNSCGQGLERGDSDWWHVDEDSECQIVDPKFTNYETGLSVTG